MPCGKQQAVHFAHLVELLPWLLERVNFTILKRCGGRSVHTHARWFARSFPFARLAVAAPGALLVLDTSFVPKNRRKTWGTDWHGPRSTPGSGGLPAGRRGCRGGRCLPLCAQQSPSATQTRR